jgi:hypothetical protein
MCGLASSVRHQAPKCHGLCASAKANHGELGSPVWWHAEPNEAESIVYQSPEHFAVHASASANDGGFILMQVQVQVSH